MDVISRQLRIRTEIPLELLREVETCEMQRAVEQLLRQKLLATVMGSESPAMTAARGDRETLTMDKLAAAVTRVVPALYYKMAVAIPKFDDDGSEFIVKVQLGKHEVFLFHPDWLPRIKAEFGSVRRLIEFDMSKYAIEEAHEECGP